MSLTPQILDELLALDALRTKGPLTTTLCNGGEKCWCRVVSAPKDAHGRDFMIGDGSVNKADADWIVAAGNTFEELVRLARIGLKTEQEASPAAPMPEKIFRGRYSWEGLGDIDRDVTESYQESPQLRGEFEGVVEVLVTYYPPERC